MKVSHILGIILSLVLIVFSLAYPVPEKHVYVYSSSDAYYYSWDKNIGAEYLGGDAYNYQVEASLKAGYFTGVVSMKSIVFVGGLLLFFLTLYSAAKCRSIAEQTEVITSSNEKLESILRKMSDHTNPLDQKTATQASTQKEMPAPQKPSPVEAKTENPSDKKADIQTKADDIQTSVQEEAVAPQSALPVEAKETKQTKPVTHKTDKDKLSPNSMVCPVCGKIQDIHNDTCESCGAKFTKWSKNHRES